MEMKLCKDCRHFWRGTQQYDKPVCKHGDCMKISLVDGSIEHWYCEAARIAGGPCGPEGRLWGRDVTA